MQFGGLIQASEFPGPGTPPHVISICWKKQSLPGNIIFPLEARPHLVSTWSKVSNVIIPERSLIFFAPKPFCEPNHCYGQPRDLSQYCIAAQNQNTNVDRALIFWFLLFWFRGSAVLSSTWVCWVLLCGPGIPLLSMSLRQQIFYGF